MSLKIPTGTIVAAMLALGIFILWMSSYFRAIGFEFRIGDVLTGLSSFNGNVSQWGDFREEYGGGIIFNAHQLVKPGTPEAAGMLSSNQPFLIKRQFGNAEFRTTGQMGGEGWFVCIPHWVVILFIMILGIVPLLSRDRES